MYLTTPDSVNVVHVLVWFGAGVRFERGYVFVCLCFVIVFFLCVVFFEQTNSEAVQGTTLLGMQV